VGKAKCALVTLTSDAYQLHNSTDQELYHSAGGLSVHDTTRQYSFYPPIDESNTCSSSINDPATTSNLSLDRALASQDSNDLLPLLTTCLFHQLDVAKQEESLSGAR
jgi:hypothetical protein